MNEYDGHWITTFTGKEFHYLDPQPDEIDIRDIAHALSLTCRFGGHIREFYSVAQHSVLVATEVPAVIKLDALLHDAHEAYLHDVPRPIKQDMEGYAKIANHIQDAVNKKFNIYTYGTTIKWADDMLLATEARDLMTTTTHWAELPTPLEEVIVPWTPEDAEETFITYYKIWSKDEKR